MVDSSKWEVIEAGLKCLQGKGIVNSISTEGRRGEISRQAKLVRRYGAAVVVMAFDERGQADSFERRTEVCQARLRFARSEIGFPPQDIIFDPNVLTVGTGMEEHANYAVDFIRATKWIKENLPPREGQRRHQQRFIFIPRQQRRARGDAHEHFSTMPSRPGSTWASSTPECSRFMRRFRTTFLELVEDVLLNRRPDATERLIKFAESVKQKDKAEVVADEWRNGTVEERLSHALVKGIVDFIDTDMRRRGRNTPGRCWSLKAR